MSNVIRLPKLIAWAPIPQDLEPGLRDSAVSLAAILCPPGEILCTDVYLSYLGDRIQGLVNAASDPQEATDTMVEDLFQAGLLPDVGHVPAREAGAYLVVSNPGTQQRLASWGVLPMPLAGEFGPTHERPAAREVLMGERYDAEDQLRSWVGLLSRLP